MGHLTIKTPIGQKGILKIVIMTSFSTMGISTGFGLVDEDQELLIVRGFFASSCKWYFTNILGNNNNYLKMWREVQILSPLPITSIG